MNNIDIANGMVFQKMGIGKDSFEARLICQKKIYLLEGLGTDLGYTYNWYVRGPYSPSLTSYVYNNLDILSTSDFSQYNLSQNAEKHIEQVNQLLVDMPQDLSEASWYELLASIVYIHKNKESWQVDDENNSLFDILRRYKPQYSMEQCENAYQVLYKKGFLEAGV